VFVLVLKTTWKGFGSKNIIFLAVDVGIFLSDNTVHSGIRCTSVVAYHTTKPGLEKQACQI
jgi:hypothetical protein